MDKLQKGVRMLLFLVSYGWENWFEWIVSDTIREQRVFNLKHIYEALVLMNFQEIENLKNNKACSCRRDRGNVPHNSILGYLNSVQIF